MLRIATHPIENNKITDFSANGIKLGTASHGPVSDLRIINNEVVKARLGGLCIESVDGSIVDGVYIHGLEMHHVGQPIFLRLGARKEGAPELIGQPLTDLRSARQAAKYSHRTSPRHWRSAERMGRGVRFVESLTAGSAACLSRMLIWNYQEASPNCRHNRRRSQEDTQRASMFKVMPGWGFYVRHADVAFQECHVKEFAARCSASDCDGGRHAPNRQRDNSLS